MYVSKRKGTLIKNVNNGKYYVEGYHVCNIKEEKKLPLVNK